jgi:mono/diheme cytochrome c family protein
VFEPPVTATAAVPLTGGTLLAMPDNKTAVAADPDRDRVFVVDYRTLAVLANVELAAGDEPGRVATDGQGRVHVALRRGGAVVTLAPSTWQIAARRPVCAAPRGIAYDAAGDLLHVACADGVLVSLPADPAVAAVTRRLELGLDLRDVVVEGERLYVSRFRSAEIIVLDRGEVRTRFLPPKTESIQQVVTSSDPHGGSGALVPVSMAPAVAWRMVASPTGGAMMLHQRAIEGEVSLTEGGYGGDFCTGGIVETGVTTVDSQGGAVAGPALAGAALAVDLAVTKNRTHVAMAVPGNARHRANFLSQVMVMGTSELVGGGGRGCAFGTPTLPRPEGSVSDPTSIGVVEVMQPGGEAVAVAFDGTGELLVQTREPATIQLVAGRSSVITLPSESRLDTGHAIFHANSGVGIACASCHPEGGEDGRVWRFRPANGGPAEPRRTQSLRGGIAMTAPFHWDGSLPTIDALMGEVFVDRMAGPELGPAHLTTLASWLDTIPKLPVLAPPPESAATVERGRAAFTTAGCGTCHAGARLTDNKNQDIGTGRGKLQTPSLFGVVWRAPYMHDGCASTLQERFSVACGGTKHGDISRLTADDLQALTAYLQTL